MNTHRFDPSYARPSGQELCVACGQPANADAHDRSRRSLEHLALANAARVAASAVKADIRSGRLTADVALFDVRASSVDVLDLMICAPGWSRARAQMLLDGLRVSHLKRVRDLNCWQRDEIARRLAPRSEAA